jgi:hypothetical protein
MFLLLLPTLPDGWEVVVGALYVSLHNVFCMITVCVSMAKWLELIFVLVKLWVQSWVVTLFNLLTGHTFMYHG